jgi:hypothetical protein
MSVSLENQLREDTRGRYITGRDVLILIALALINTHQSQS